jgi:hypothetical protein
LNQFHDDSSTTIEGLSWERQTATTCPVKWHQNRECGVNPNPARSPSLHTPSLDRDGRTRVFVLVRGAAGPKWVQDSAEPSPLNESRREFIELPAVAHGKNAQLCISLSRGREVGQNMDTRGLIRLRSPKHHQPSKIPCCCLISSRTV